MCKVRQLLLFLSCFIFSSALIASPFWDADLIAYESTENLQLKDQNGKIYSTIQPRVVRIVIDAKNKIELAAGGIRPHLWIDAEEKANAFATYKNDEPTIAINIGMLRALGEDEEAYAALIGHELAHLYLGHTAKSLARNGAKNAASMILGFVLGYAGVPAGGTIADITTTAISSVYSRDDERAADAEGLKYMVQAGYNPYGAVHMQEKLAAANSVISIPFLSTHPSSSERIKNMNQLAETAKLNQVRNTSAVPIDNTLDYQNSTSSNVYGASDNSDGENCVGINTHIGDNIRTPDGHQMVVKNIIGITLICRQIDFPVRAILEPTNYLPPSEIASVKSKTNTDMLDVRDKQPVSNDKEANVPKPKLTPSEASFNDDPDHIQLIAQKLRELNQLYLEKVISTSDYNEMRKRLIDQL